MQERGSATTIDVCKESGHTCMCNCGKCDRLRRDAHDRLNTFRQRGDKERKR